MKYFTNGKTLLACIFALLLTFKSNAQLNSLDIYAGPHKFLNSYYKDPKEPMGWNYGLRYNLDFSWEWAAMFSVGMDKSTFNMATTRDLTGLVPAQVTNTYADFTLGLEWQWMTEIRTRMGGGKVSCRGSKSIIMANFKSYLLGGLNYKMLMNSTSKDMSSKSLMSWNAGIGFEWFRFGKNAHHGNNAFVPFTEFIYASNMSNPYAEDLSQKIFFKSFIFRFGIKYTFGFPEKKFAWK